MAGWLEEGRLVAAVLVAMAAEAAVLTLLLWRRDRRRLVGLLATLAAGAALLLALWAALAGAGRVWIGASLAAALAAHLVDLLLRLRR